jgi:hypothetical protein
MILLYFMLVACPASLSVAAGLLRGDDDDFGVDADRVSVDHRHGHRGGGHRSSSHERRHDDGGSKENGGGDFDFYVYSMTHQPEFCRENDERYAGCRDHQESWEWQLTIHGLWPNVSFSCSRRSSFMVVEGATRSSLVARRCRCYYY